MILNTALKLEKAMTEAQSYAEWSASAIKHDIETGVAEWKNSDESKHFDYQSIRRRLTRLSALWKAQDNEGLLYNLNEGIHGNMDGMGNDRLHQKAKFGTKQLIVDYVDAIADSLEYLSGPKVSDISFDDKIDFFRRAQHCYGRSAFMMSGSGSFLFFHLGVVKALWAQGLLPNIISGSSGGSIVGAIVCTHTDVELDRLLKSENILELIGPVNAEISADTKVKRMTTPEVREAIAAAIPDLTFQEAYELTGRQLNVSIAPAERHQTSRLLNAITSPNVYIREAVMASSAVPGIFEPVALAAKNHKGKRQPYLPNRRWVDGSVTNDLPAKRLGRLYGVNHYIVSQANPLITPFASEFKQDSSPINQLLRAGSITWRTWLNTNVSLLQKPLSYFPRMQGAVNMAMSVVNQDYTGDINIVRPTLFWSPAKLLAQLPVEDMEFLIDLGERATWPKIEMVRTQTRISKTLDDILFGYEYELIDEHDDALEPAAV